MSARTVTRTDSEVYRPSMRLPPAHGIMYSRRFESMNMDDLQCHMASGALTPQEQRTCMILFVKKLYPPQ